MSGNVAEPKLSLHSSETSDEGGIEANSITQLLGAVPMDPLTLLIRESVQNSWDASLHDGGTPSYQLDFRTLVGEALSMLKGKILPTSPPAASLDLSSLRSSSALDCVFVTDWGTTGLNGPTSARYPIDGYGGDANYKNFLLMVGKTKDDPESGGSYGFGKGSYYLASRVRTIVAFTRCMVKGKMTSRLVAVGVGTGLDDPPLTGKHFWGTGDKAHPLEGAPADELASSLGFPLPAGETGTSVLVLDVDKGQFADGEERTLSEAVQHAKEQLLWNCWPKMATVDGRSDMQFYLFHEDQEATEVNARKSYPPALRAYMRAYERLATGDHAIPIRLRRPKRELGRLALEFVTETNPTEGFGTEPSNGFRVPTNHVALLRAPHLVVKYLEPRSPEAAGFHWGGVFLADSAEDVEQAFKESEPPAHNDWVPEHVDPGTRTFVKIALVRIDDAITKRFRSTPSAQSSQHRGAVSQLSDELGSAFSTEGFAPGGGGGGGGGGGRPSTARPAISDPVVHQVSGAEGGGTVVIARAEISHAKVGWNLEVQARAGMDDGQIDSEADDQPTVLGWSAEPEADPAPFPRSLAGADSEIFVHILCPPEIAPVVILSLEEAP